MCNINNLKLTMSDGSESKLLGNKMMEPNLSFSLPSNIKIAKLRSGFGKNPNYPGLYDLVQFELSD